MLPFHSCGEQSFSSTAYKTPNTNSIVLGGTLQRQTDPASLAAVSQLFTNYLNGDTSPVIATGQSTLQTDNSTISWLSQGLQALSLEVPFKAFTPIDPIRTITIGNLGLEFDESSPWTPSAESNTVQATLRMYFFGFITSCHLPAPIELPFGFNLAIGEIQNEFNIVKDGNTVAGLSTVCLILK